MLKSPDRIVSMVTKIKALMRTTVSVLFFFLGFSIFLLGQGLEPLDSQVDIERCGAVFIEKKQADKMGYFGSREYFEDWIDDKKKEIQELNAGSRLMLNEIRQIPVVIHVIHQGEAIGEGTNISELQILDQIRIINEDFQQRNADFSNTPTEFLNVASSPNLEFVLAKQRPDGLPTNGINRVQGPKNEYSSRDAALVADMVSWSPEEYLNIWVLPLIDVQLGYSSFPVSDELEGLTNPPTFRDLDGIGVDTYHFGSIGNVVESSEGRTATHELGHFFGLRHIWGDGGCEEDDFVEDTPLQDGFNAVCSNTPRQTCNSRDMIENYMDYTPDRCMSLFTEGQVERMDVVLAFSPRRNSLLSSRALQEPEMPDLDLALETILSPVGFNCTEEVPTQVRVRNTGMSTVSNVMLELSLNGEVKASQSFEVNLATDEHTDLTFDPVVFPGLENNLELSIMEVNGSTDGNPFNNTLQTIASFVREEMLPYNYPGHSSNNGWDVLNPDNAVTWQAISRMVDGVPQDLFYVNSFNYNGSGELDYLISPRFDLTDIPRPQLSFNMAYAPYNNPTLQENLLVAISTDCGNTFDLLTAPYNKTEESLATQPPTLNEFIPDASGQFRKEVINLSPYAGNPDVRIAFVSINGFGNNLYIKDIEVQEEEVFSYEFALTSLENPLPIISQAPGRERLQIRNQGNLDIEQFRVVRKTNLSFRDTLVVEESLVAGTSAMVVIENENPLRPGLNRLDYILRDPNFDQNQPPTDELSYYLFADNTRIPSPWRANFDNDTEFDNWVSLNPESNRPGWDTYPESNGESDLLLVSRMESDNSYWLASPEFSLEGTSRASVFFNWAGLGFDPESLATFSVWVSTNGGYSGNRLWEVTGVELETLDGLAGSLPDSKEQFEAGYINLSSYAGRENVRLYFKVEGVTKPEAIVYLDDIELFLSDNPDPVDPGANEVLLYPNPANDLFNLVFKLEEYEDIRIEIYNTTGQMAYKEDFPNTLNQTYSFSKALLSPGVFVIKITGDRWSEVKRLILR
ncbi:M43 family zinc metalloprotease [Cyclobacterium jeungdonense]|uniref:M43 family zinc metalloprotease n=1 Tax=Cyclobacterium jeungdonense TaxID=708087 RepID=A0ABT8C3P2_9BACT|nr:M43 family zinc metalloprotease [Cyclobacterium jeungdonense]MDN3687383.1 M43 family zinc metalloprotease [Cyclobacterium jeungdonense]